MTTTAQTKLNIGILEEPHLYRMWPGIKALLQTAARRSGSPAWEPGHQVWVVVDGPQIIAAATTRLVEGGEAELWHIAGTRVREWLADLDRLICEWATMNGAHRITCQGRKGWAKLSEPLGYRVYGKCGGMTYYEKVLK